jgi:hypothetical protein
LYPGINISIENFDNIAILLVWTLLRPIARWGRKQNCDIPVLDVKSHDGWGTEWNISHYSASTITSAPSILSVTLSRFFLFSPIYSVLKG